MTLDKILASLFPVGHNVVCESGLISGRGRLPDGRSMAVIGVEGQTPVGVEEAASLASDVIDVIKSRGNEPILVLIDSGSQRMSKRDELLGINELLAHLAKCLMLADKLGHRTVGLLYGHTAAGAFIATALATRTLFALPGAEPAVMDLPSMSRVTKLSIDVLEEKAKSTPVFAPGLDNLFQTGAVAITLDPAASLADQLQAQLSRPIGRDDNRDQLGAERNGRPKAADVARRVHELACASA